MPIRTIHCEDALNWLNANRPLSGCSIVTSLPDISEFPSYTLDQWKEWFVSTASLILNSVVEDGVAIFYQTDIKFEGTWVDKSYLCQKAAELTGHHLLWHKIVCRSAPGTVSFGRPGYSHMLCFSRGIRMDLAKARTDVLPEAGATTWTRGMGVKACEMACKFVLDHTTTRTIVAPFCGHGITLAVANSLGLDAIGIELSPKRARKARAMGLTEN